MPLRAPLSALGVVLSLTACLPSEPPLPMIEAPPPMGSSTGGTGSSTTDSTVVGDIDSTDHTSDASLGARLSASEGSSSETSSVASSGSSTTTTTTTPWECRRSFRVEPQDFEGVLDGAVALVRTPISWLEDEDHPLDLQSLRFLAEDGMTPIPFELDPSATADGQVLAWIGIGSIVAGTPVSGFITTHGPTSPTANDATAVWTHAYQAVYHFDRTTTDATGRHHVTVPKEANLVETGLDLGQGAEFRQEIIGRTIQLDDLTSNGAAFALSVWVLVPSGRSNRTRRGVLGGSTWGLEVYDAAAAFDAGTPLLYRLRTACGATCPGSLDDPLLPFPDSGAVVDAWHHVGLSVDGSTATLFVNGQPSAPQALQSPLEPALGVILGLEPGTFTATFHYGFLDEFRMFSTPQSAARFRWETLAVSSDVVAFGERSCSDGPSP